MELEGLPEGTEALRYGEANPPMGEYIYAGGALIASRGQGLVVRAVDGYTIGLNHYTNQYAVTKSFDTPQVVTLRVTLLNSRHLDILNEVQLIAKKEQIAVEILTPELQADGV
jgi:acyl dehydratase